MKCEMCFASAQSQPGGVLTQTLRYDPDYPIMLCMDCCRSIGQVPVQYFDQEMERYGKLHPSTDETCV